jgi:hypothetical protein
MTHERTMLPLAEVGVWVGCACTWETVTEDWDSAAAAYRTHMAEVLTAPTSDSFSTTWGAVIPPRVVGPWGGLSLGLVLSAAVWLVLVWAVLEAL